MAAPASFKTLSPSSHYPAQSTTHPDQRDLLLNITPEDLKKKGFDGKAWADYLKTDFLPWQKETLMEAHRLTSDPIEKNEITDLGLKSESTFSELIKLLWKFPYNAKAWNKYCLGEIKEITLLVETAICIVSIFRDRNCKLLPDQKHWFAEFPKKISLLDHLCHLLLDRLSKNLISNNQNCFARIEVDRHLPDVKPKAFLAVKQEGTWRSMGGIVWDEKNRSFRTWSGENETPHLLHSVLIQGDQTFQDTPFIGVTLALVGNTPEIRAALQNPKPFEFVHGQTPLQTKVTYCCGNPQIQGAGNATVFERNVGSTFPESLRGLKQCHNEGKENKDLLMLTSTALRSIQGVWEKEIQAQRLTVDKLTSKYIYLLPKTKEEAAERMIETLEQALEAPEENAQLIEYIAEQCAFSYSQVEIVEAHTLAKSPLPAILAEEIDAVQEASPAAASAASAAPVEQIETVEMDLLPAVMAHAVIEKLKKQRPKAQRPKERQVHAAAASSSSRRQLISKEELHQQLSASSMPAKLAGQASDLLSGERLAGKRAEDKFFFEILSYQAKASGSRVQTGNKSGSHHSIKLVKQLDGGGKATYRAATLVNKHGIDANRGHSLSVQQDKLLRLFTPLV